MFHLLLSGYGEEGSGLHIPEFKMVLMGEDVRYPTLVIDTGSDTGASTVGYSLDLHTGLLSRVCICAAHEPSECICGAWDNYEE